MDFLKQERILDQLDRSTYDVIVMDEAHHYMDLGAAGEREDSLRRRMAETLARRCDALLLLTATPHDGNDRSFASLCELLDPSLVDGRGVLRGDRYMPYVVRRLKAHVKDPVTKLPMFKDRIVHPGPVTATKSNHPAFIELQRSLLDLIAPELRRAFHNRRYADVLSFIALLKRSVSTVAACKSTLTVVADRFNLALSAGVETQEARRQRLQTLREYNRKLERFGSVSADEEAEQQLLEAEDLAQQLAAIEREVRSGSRQVAKVASIVEALDELVEKAEEALTQDPKLMQLIAEIKAIRKAEPRASILVYTEYTDSQAAAYKALAGAGIERVLTMRGDDPENKRTETTARFRTEENLVLISTDAAAEGLNLHQRCHHLIHLELPFNPNRLEQRNGRIDRYGQTYEPQVRYLYLRGTFEERILMRLIAKWERQRAKLKFMPNTLGLTIAPGSGPDRLLKGIMDEDAKLFQDEGPAFNPMSEDENDGADPATRELLEEVDRSLKSFEKATKSHSWLAETGLNADERLMNEAAQARERGTKGNCVDLAQFVADAVCLDGGELMGQLTDDYFTLSLPPAWCAGMDDLPGFDLPARQIRLTTKMEVTEDEKERSVGYIGRAHPLVRRALDRVRNLSYGTSAQQSLDPRASAVKADVPEPTVLYTYLGRVSSGAGRKWSASLPSA